MTRAALRTLLIREQSNEAFPDTVQTTGDDGRLAPSRHNAAYVGFSKISRARQGRKGQTSGEPTCEFPLGSNQRAFVLIVQRDATEPRH
ncbi:hypothetical protein E2C01_098604 [Portunus trituberculatus]|uniref:Uncharacterized protein n=1 Tax=Portunus trituberculatus TaxID=210409 RepID=A0A5B7K1M3_PORTR|nr:hypothetical protein [Portunus trituberculatus]